MTRACPSTVGRPASPKTKSAASSASQPLRMAQDGGIVKKTPTSVAKTSFKALAKSYSKDECFAQLKNLLPKARQSESTSELALVEETIAYIAYLERILQESKTEQEDGVSSALVLLKNMKF